MWHKFKKIAQVGAILMALCILCPAQSVIIRVNPCSKKSHELRTSGTFARHFAR